MVSPGSEGCKSRATLQWPQCLRKATSLHGWSHLTASSRGDGPSYNAALPVHKDSHYVLTNNRPKCPTVLVQTPEPQVLSRPALYGAVEETLSICGSTLSARSCRGWGGCRPRCTPCLSVYGWNYRWLPSLVPGLGHFKPEIGSTICIMGRYDFQWDPEG